MTAITETPAHIATRTALDNLVTAGKIRIYGVTTKGRYFVRTNDGRRIANMTVTRAADFAAFAASV